MAGSDQLGFDALAVLMVPLVAQPPGQAMPGWHRWDEAYGELCGLDATKWSAHEVRPFKRYPISEWHYFNEHVEHLLFPRREDPGERWIQCPENLFLCASERRGEPQHVARVDLLERLLIPGRADCAFGLIHLSLEPGAVVHPDAHPLWWAWAIRSQFRRSTIERPYLELRDGRGRAELRERRPIRELVARTLGDPHPDLERRLYTAVMAPCPPSCRDDKDQEHWLRTVARRGRLLLPEDQAQVDLAKVHEQAIRIGKGMALVRGDGAVLTQTEQLNKDDARNFRSYWSESLVAGVLQHESLEHFQTRLAAIGSPIQPEIEPLYRAWLEFRNRIWWSQLSTSATVPQELLERFRAARGTERLFTDLEGDLATYSAQRRSIVDAKQAEALANLQVGGAVVAVLGVVLAIIAVTGAHAWLLVGLILLAFLVAAAAGAFVQRQLPPREERPPTP